MLSIGNKKYRNLQEQVGYNTECIKKLDEYLDGIRVEDKLVVIESDSGTFTDEELVTLSGPLAFISNGSRVWMKDSETLVEFVYKAIDIKADEVGNAYFNIGGSKIVVNRETGAYNTSSDTIIKTYSKDQIDSIIANIMDVKADKSELTAGLALKANVAGQAFTGAITAPSITEDMNGYGITKNTPPTDVTYDFIYGGIVKNGNKLTCACVVNVNSTSEIGKLTAMNICDFVVPSDVASKLYGFDIGSTTGCLGANASVSFFEGTISFTSARMVFLKRSTNHIRCLCYPETALSADVDHLLRFEITFLLSDNLAS